MSTTTHNDSVRPTRTADQPTRSSHPDDRLVRTSRPGPLLRGILADWESACSSPRALRRANGWGLPGGPAEHLDDIVLRAGFGGATDCDEADAYLLALVTRAASDPLAAQIVLHRVLPPVISIAQRRGKLHPGGIEGAVGDLVAQAWFVITSYPVERRPRKVAANIVRDIEYHEFVSGRRPRRTSVRFVDHDSFAAGEFDLSVTGVSAPPDADELHNLMIQLEMRGVSRLRLEIMRLSFEGWHGTEIGRRLGLKERTVRWHRAEALRAAADFIAEFRPAFSTDDAPRCGAAG